MALSNKPAPSTASLDEVPPSSPSAYTFRSRLFRVGKKFLLSILGLVLALLIAEGLLRLFAEQETKRLAVYDKELGWRGKPHGKGLYVGSNDKIRVPFSYNNLGFRDEDVAGKQDRGSPRLLLLGDSFLESLEIGYDGIFHELIETQLQGKVHALAEVIAIGSQGYSNAQELLAFRRYREMVKPDVVLTLFYSGNDFDDNVRKQFACLKDDGRLEFPVNRDSPRQILVMRCKRWLYEHSHLVFLVKNRLQTWMHLDWQDPSKQTADHDPEYKLQITSRLIQQTQIEVEQSGANYALVLIPSREEIRDRDFQRLMSLETFSSREKIPYLRLDLSLEHFFETDIHLNDAGHEIVADQILQFVSEQFPRHFAPRHFVPSHEAAAGPAANP